MKTIPDIIEMCLSFAEKEISKYDDVYIFACVLGKRKEHTEKYTQRIVKIFYAADMIYEMRF